MENIDDPTVRESDNQTVNPQSGSGDPISGRQTGLEAPSSETTPPDSPEEIALKAVRDENIVRHVRRLADNPNTAAFAQNEEYLKGVARQIGQGNAPFRPQAHHVWNLNVKPGTRL